MFEIYVVALNKITLFNLYFRLKDENRVCTIIDKVDKYLEGRGTSNELCRVYMRKISHLYYKFDHQAMIKLRDDKDKVVTLFIVVT